MKAGYRCSASSWTLSSGVLGAAAGSTRTWSGTVAGLLLGELSDRGLVLPSAWLEPLAAGAEDMAGGRLRRASGKSVSIMRQAKGQEHRYTVEAKEYTVAMYTARADDNLQRTTTGSEVDVRSIGRRVAVLH
jgi:hypothetical protein